MNVSRLFLTMVVTVCVGLAPALATNARATPPGDTSFVLPVLVELNHDGKVVAVDPALRLPAALQRLLQASVVEIISHSGHDCRGTCTGGTAVMKLAMHLTPAAHGNYKVNFEYRSLQRLGSGPWHWCLKRAKNQTASHPFTAYLTPGDKHVRCAAHPSGQAYAFGRWNTRITLGTMIYGPMH